MATLIAASTCSSPLHAPLNNPNEGVRVFSVKALVEGHTFQIDDVVKRWGYIDDKATRDGHLYQSKAPLPTLLAAAAYGAVHLVTGDLSREKLTRLCRLFGGALPAALVFGATWWVLRQRPKRINDDSGGGAVGDGERDDVATRDVIDAVMVTLVVGTGVLATFHVFSGHALAAACSALLVALIRDARLRPGADLDVVRAAVAGVAVGVAVGAEYPAALSAPLALVLVARSPRPGAVLVAGVVAAFVALAPTLVAHQIMWGAPWRTGYSFLENAAYRPLVSGTLFGIGAPDARALFTSLVSAELGLFFYSPLLLLGLLPLLRPPRWMGPVERAVIVVVVVAYVAFIAGFRGWRGGWSVGPRYISELMGILSLLAVDALHPVRQQRRVVVVVALGAIGVLHSGIAGAFFPHLPDRLATPVGTLVLPQLWRGFAPDTLWLSLGASSSAAAALVAVGLFVPLLLVSLRVRFACFGLAVVVPAAIVDVATARHGAPDALEVRRMMDNWRPEAGNPYLVDGGRERDAAALFAVDRARALARQDLACESPRPREAKRDVGAGADVIRAVVDVSEAEIIVVDDALADHIGAAGGAAIIMAVADTRVMRQLPCQGRIDVVLPRGAPWPKHLAPLARPTSSADITGSDHVLWHTERLPLTGPGARFAP